MTPLIQEFLETMEREPTDILPVPLDAPTDAEVRAAWEQTIQPDFDPTCGCGDPRCCE